MSGKQTSKMVVCNQCNREFNSTDAGLAYCLGAEPVFVCIKCAPPANGVDGFEFIRKFIEMANHDSGNHSEPA